LILCCWHRRLTTGSCSLTCNIIKERTTDIRSTRLIFTETTSNISRRKNTAERDFLDVFIRLKFHCTTSFFLLLSVSIPLYAHKFIFGQWYLGYHLCKLWLVFDYVVGSASTLCILVISYDRYQMVSQGLNYLSNIRIKRALQFMIGTWTIATLNYGRRLGSRRLLFSCCYWSNLLTRVELALVGSLALSCTIHNIDTRSRSSPTTARMNRVVVCSSRAGHYSLGLATRQ
jgi:hypothetical protein